MMRRVESMFEGLLWNSRWVVIVAVLASIAGAMVLVYVTTADVVSLVGHASHYVTTDDVSPGPGLASPRAELRNATVAHVVEIVDGYLLATFLLIFGLGLYELFISDIDQAKAARAASKVLVIESLDDLKSRLAKVVLLILVVRIFEHAVQMRVDTTADLLRFAGAIALVGLALFLAHRAEGHAAAETDGEKVPH